MLNAYRQIVTYSALNVFRAKNAKYFLENAEFNSKLTQIKAFLKINGIR